MTVSSEEGLSRFCKSFQVNLMADAISGSGKKDSVLCRKGLQKSVIICIFKPGLKHIMIDVADREHGLDPWKS